MTLKAGHFSFQQSPLDVESSTLLGANVSSDTEAPRENERPTRRGAAPNPGEGASGDEDLGITGQASSMWNQTVNQNPELSGIMKAFEKYIPFIVIVTVKCLFEHATGKKWGYKCHPFRYINYGLIWYQDGLKQSNL